jgi:hypothetical protein
MALMNSVLLLPAVSGKKRFLFSEKLDQLRKLILLDYSNARQIAGNGPRSGREG